MTIGGRVLLQGLFFIIVPKILSNETASVVFILFSISSILTIISSFGGQFDLISGIARDDRDAIESGTMRYAFGFFIIAIFSIPLSYLYELLKNDLLWIAVYIMAVYSRMYYDSVMQAEGKLYSSQRLYIIFWAFKIFATYILAVNIVEFDTKEIALIEVISSIPWIIMGTIKFNNLKLNLYKFNFSRIVTSGSIWSVLSSITRGIWLEGDKLVLPYFVSSLQYVEYSLVSRVFTAGMAFSASYIGSLTPSIVKSKNIDDLARSRSYKNNVAISVIIIILGFTLTVIIYPELLRYIPAMILFSFCTYYFMLSSLYSDFVFYKISIIGRVKVNLVGATIVFAGAILSRYLSINSVVVGILLSYVYTSFYAKSIANGGK